METSAADLEKEKKSVFDSKETRISWTHSTQRYTMGTSWINLRSSPDISVYQLVRASDEYLCKRALTAAGIKAHREMIFAFSSTPTNKLDKLGKEARELFNNELGDIMRDPRERKKVMVDLVKIHNNALKQIRKFSPRMAEGLEEIDEKDLAKGDEFKLLNKKDKAGSTRFVVARVDGGYLCSTDGEMCLKEVKGPFDSGNFYKCIKDALAKEQNPHARLGYAMGAFLARAYVSQRDSIQTSDLVKMQMADTFHKFLGKGVQDENKAIDDSGGPKPFIPPEANMAPGRSFTGVLDEVHTTSEPTPKTQGDDANSKKVDQAVNDTITPDKENIKDNLNPKNLIQFSCPQPEIGKDRSNKSHDGPER